MSIKPPKFPAMDIRPFKKELRERYKEIRRKMPDDVKEQCDRKIANRLMNLWQYRESQTILFYVSTPIEVDTHYAIKCALEAGKKVAVPRCVPNTYEMDFYYINSMDDLEPGTFGVLEPNVEVCEKMTDFTEGLCIVPALSFDRGGYRLGYGKGYYDRFLVRFHGQTAGLCYESCMRLTLPRGKFDEPVNYVITEKRMNAIKK